MSNSGLLVFWSDDNLKNKLGESWVEEIENSLGQSKHFILVCTKTSMRSKWVKREYRTFFNHCYDEGKRRLIPLLIEDYKINDLPLFLRNLQAFRYIEDESLSSIISLLGGTDIEKLKVEIEKLHKENNILKKENKKLKGQLEGKDLKRMESTINDLHNEINDLKMENKKLRSQTTDKDFKKMETKIKDLINENEALNIENKNFKSQISSNNLSSKLKASIEITCLMCGASISPGSPVCPACGARVPPLKAKLSTEKLICSTCGATIPLSSLTCPACGAPAPIPTSPKAVSPNESPKLVLKEYACPYCNNIFSAETSGKPIIVYCPTCNEQVTVM